MLQTTLKPNGMAVTMETTTTAAAAEVVLTGIRLIVVLHLFPYTDILFLSNRKYLRQAEAARKMTSPHTSCFNHLAWSDMMDKCH
jgi:hypothetical protein